MLYDDELRSPTDGHTSLIHKIADYDYETRLAAAKTEVAIAHLVPQVCCSGKVVCFAIVL